jgi:hypothetical protein
MLLFSRATLLNRAPSVSFACLPRSFQERLACRRILFPLIPATNHACKIADIFHQILRPHVVGSILLASCPFLVKLEHLAFPTSFLRLTSERVSEQAV